VPDPSSSGLDSAHFEKYLRICEEERSDWRKKVARIDVDVAVFDGDEVIEVVDPIYQEYSEDSGLFKASCGFSLRDFNILYDLLSGVLDVQRRGRHRVIGQRDSLLIFLHWIRTDNSMASIAQSLRICEDTLYRRVRELIHLVHDPLVNQFITGCANAPFTAGEAFPGCGLIVDATVQYRGIPVGRYEEAPLVLPEVSGYCESIGMRPPYRCRYSWIYSRFSLV
jgi:hypothetical protein